MMKNSKILKVAVVTGAGKGIGREIAKTFAASGARVIIADRDDESGNATAAAIESAKGICSFIHADISDASDIVRLMSETVHVYGAIDILVNNAGFGLWIPPAELTVDQWDSVIDTNLRGTFLCSREAARYMKERGGGLIINIASTRAFMSEPNSEAYAASKGGIIALTHAMAASYSKDQIRVNCISPGWIETGDYGALRDIDHSQHFSGRVGKPEDIAKACIFLFDNDFINGENIIIDGGMTRKMIYAP